MTAPLKLNSEKPQKLLWQPDVDGESNIERFMAFAGARTGERFDDYASIHQWSVDHNDEFWSAFWDFAGILGDKGEVVHGAIDQVPWVRFFPDSQISYAENMLSRAQKTPDEPAIIARQQNGGDRIITWQDLYDQVSVWERALKGAGLEEGDHIGAYLPNVPESVFLLLASSNIGAVFSSIGTEMGQSDLIERFGQFKPKIFIAADGYVHGSKVISRNDVNVRVQEKISSIEQTIVLGVINDEHSLDGLSDAVRASEFLAPHVPSDIDFIRRDFNHPLYVLFSSGSSGTPKCFEHSSGGVLLKHMSEYLLHAEVEPGERMFYHASPSWMMWNWLASGLAADATILMYDGSPVHPDIHAQWKFTSDHGCTHHGTAAPVILSWSDEGARPAENCDLSDLQMVLSTGAVLPESGFQYLHDHVKADVKIGSISGGTDLVACFVGGNALTPTYAGDINGAMMGMDVQVWDDRGKPVKPGEAGELVCVNAFPSMPLRFLNDPDGVRYSAEYFEHYTGQNVWRHGDSIQKTLSGQLRIIGRSDATLNQNGVRIGTVMIYNQLEPFKDRVKGATAVDFMRPDNQQPATILFLALDEYESGVPDDLSRAVKKAVKDNVTPYAIPTEIIAVPDVLKTPNGKLAEIVTKKVVNGENIPNPSLYGEELVRFYEDIARRLKAKYSLPPPSPENNDGGPA